ncbi:S9 family peptidase (plasmid) [Hymenobacter qilianensis]|uniref:S9 family peptidase n=1 Tax=Hymenobacter qilianensis TaxID=1385715 RepID=A0A7H0H121_9BACT|nr:S9 family peptidase [Hymenobacter qilianensis]
MAFSPDNKQVLVTRLASRGSNDLYLYNLATKEEKLLTRHEGPGTFFGEIAPSGQVYLGFNKDRDLLAFGQSTPHSIQLLAERKDAELADFTLNHAGTQAVLVWNEKGRNKLTLFDLKTNKETQQLVLPVELVAGVAFSPNDQTIIFTGSGSKEPTNIWVYTLGSNHFRKLTDSPHPGVNLATLVAPELVSFPSFDGVPLSGWLYKPQTGKGPFPTVISYHGGPEGQSVPSLNPTAQALVQQGVAFFLPNVRGSSGFGKAFLNLDNGPLRVNGVKDIKAVSDYLVQAGLAKAGALGIMGAPTGATWSWPASRSIRTCLPPGPTCSGWSTSKPSFSIPNPGWRLSPRWSTGTPSRRRPCCGSSPPFTKPTSSKLRCSWSTAPTIPTCR